MLSLPAVKATPPDLFAGMNKLERGYAMELEADKRNGLIAEWWYEAWTFKLAEDTRYTPDFVILTNDGTLEIAETKGFMRDDAHVKLKVFAALFPFKVTLVSKDGTKDYTSPRRKAG